MDLQVPRACKDFQDLQESRVCQEPRVLVACLEKRELRVIQVQQEALVSQGHQE